MGGTIDNCRNAYPSSPNTHTLTLLLTACRFYWRVDGRSVHGYAFVRLFFS